MRYNNIQGQQNLLTLETTTWNTTRTEFVNYKLTHLYFHSNNITDATAINQYLQNFRGLRYVSFNANPMNFQNTKKLVQDTNLSDKDDSFTLNLMNMRKLSDIEIKELVITW